jgi:hypothetical protein
MTDIVADAVQGLGIQIDNCPSGSAAADLRIFGQYLTERSAAIAARSNGDIDKALQHERVCEILYKRLPEDWRW